MLPFSVMAATRSRRRPVNPRRHCIRQRAEEIRASNTVVWSPASIVIPLIDYYMPHIQVNDHYIDLLAVSGCTGSWSGGESPNPPQKKGGRPNHPISAQAFMCRLMSSGFELTRISRRTACVRGSEVHRWWLPGESPAVTRWLRPAHVAIAATRPVQIDPIPEESANPAAAALAPADHDRRPLPRRSAAGRVVLRPWLAAVRR